MTIYEIRVQGHLPPDWSERFGGMVISHASNGETILRGLLHDQAALFGVVLNMRDLGLTLLSVHQIDADPPPGE